MSEPRWIVFTFDGSTGKTSRWTVVNKDTGEYIGMVKWYGRWRGYAFFPKQETIYEQRCLRDIAEFIEQQNIAHKGAVMARKDDARPHK